VIATANGVDVVRRKPLRVCHVAYTFYERDNRVQRYARALAERGDAVDVLALRVEGDPVHALQDGVHLYRLQRRQVNEGRAVGYLAKLMAFLMRAMARVSARHLAQPYDVVHIHNMPDFLVFAGWLPKLAGARIILDIHDLLPEFYSDKFHRQEGSWTVRSLRWVERRATRFAHHVIVAGDLWRDKLIDRAGLAPDQVTTLLNHPDRRMFRPQVGSRGRDGKFVVLYPGTLNHHQGVDIAVRAFALASARMPNAEFHIYGDGPARTAIATLITELGLSGRVKLERPVPIETIARLMSAADLGVIPKRAEGFGNEAFSTKSLEFMACGVPVIMSRTQVDRRHFDDSIVRFFDPGVPEALADAILRDYQSAEERLARAQRASAFVAEVDWAAKLPSYLRIVEGTSAGRAEAPAHH
jgi:glycosyltransferase involved in cell wall biosynthesis